MWQDKLTPFLVYSFSWSTNGTADGGQCFGRTAVVILLCHMGLMEVLLLVELYQPEE